MAETGGHHAVINGSARTYHTGCCFRAAGEGRVVGQGAGGSAWCVSASASVLIGVFASARGCEKTRLSVPTHGIAEHVCLRVSRNNMSVLLYCAACPRMCKLIN